jgi:hypothetical protein
MKAPSSERVVFRCLSILHSYSFVELLWRYNSNELKSYYMQAVSDRAYICGSRFWLKFSSAVKLNESCKRDIHEEKTGFQRVRNWYRNPSRRGEDYRYEQTDGLSRYRNKKVGIYFVSLLGPCIHPIHPL